MFRGSFLGIDPKHVFEIEQHNVLAAGKIINNRSRFCSFGIISNRFLKRSPPFSVGDHSNDAQLQSLSKKTSARYDWQLDAAEHKGFR